MGSNVKRCFPKENISAKDAEIRKIQLSLLSAAQLNIQLAGAATHTQKTKLKIKRGTSAFFLFNIRLFKK